MMSFGVPFGTTSATQLAPSTSGKPASAIVGVSGSDLLGVFELTASARSLPSLMSGTAGVIAPNDIVVWPATVEPTAGPPPLNGTCTRSGACESLNNSPTSCGGVPTPGDAKLYL